MCGGERAPPSHQGRQRHEAYAAIWTHESCHECLEWTQLQQAAARATRARSQCRAPLPEATRGPRLGAGRTKAGATRSPSVQAVAAAAAGQHQPGSTTQQPSLARCYTPIGKGIPRLVERKVRPSQARADQARRAAGPQRRIGRRRERPHRVMYLVLRRSRRPSSSASTGSMRFRAPPTPSQRLRPSILAPQRSSAGGVAAPGWGANLQEGRRRHWTPRWRFWPVG